jgi:hypothetical protein
MKVFHATCLIGLAGIIVASPVSKGQRHLRFKDITGVSSDSIHNVHVDYVNENFDGELHMI